MIFQLLVFYVMCACVCDKVAIGSAETQKTTKLTTVNVVPY